MSIQVSPHLAKRRIVKDLQGNIVDLYQEGDGGWIIRGREVINQEKWDEITKKKQDEIQAASAIAHAKVDENAPDRTVDAKTAVENLAKATKQEEKVAELDKKVTDMDSKLDAILKALNGKS